MADLSSMDCSCNPWNNTCINRIYHHLSEADAPLAMSYVPYQQWSTTFEPCKGLQAGTIFPCLYKPFCGKGGRNC